MFILAFSRIDWLILAAYFALMAVVGTLASRKKTDAEGYFLADRSMPMFAVALSVVATSLSVATFLGAPQQSYTNDLTYLSLNIGGFIAVFVVAALFIPRFYAAGTVTIYGYIDQRFGETSRLAVSCMFLLGRLLASGVRLFFAALPVCLLFFSETRDGHLYVATKQQLIFAICLIGAVGTAYTIAGGIRAVIWTDTIQIIIVLGAVLLSIGLLLHKIPLGLDRIWHELANTPGKFNDGGSKLRILDFSLNPSHPFTFWTALIGGTFLNVAAFGVDHDLAQRMLTAKSPWRGGLSLILSQFISVFVVSLFMAVGLLLFIFYKRPDLMGAHAPADMPGASGDVYAHFLLNHLPVGLAGLAMAGMFAIAQGSLDSAINAMASSVVADLYWPLRRRLGKPVDTSHGAKAPRLAVAATGAVLIAFAVSAVFIYDREKKTLLDFALGVMAFAYTGMLGVFLTALLTRRGNTKSVLAALVTGLLVTSLLQDSVMTWWTTLLFRKPLTLASFWWMPIGTVLAFIVCVLGDPEPRETWTTPQAFPVTPL
jgi:solute:Na+ symporter, SSS family